MTLDTFQKTMESLAAKFKADMVELITRGMAASLDDELMFKIIEREMEKLQND